MRNEKGFTMTEVLIVVVILAVLAALAIPRFFAQGERGVAAEAVAHLSAIRQAEASYFLEKSSTYTANLTDLDLDVTSTKFNYTVDAGTGTATATRVNGGTFTGQTIILKMDGTWDQSATHPFKPT